MKKGTVFGIILSVLCILALIGLGVYLMLDLQGTLSGHTSAAPQKETSVSILKEKERQAEPSTEAAGEIDVQTAAALSAAKSANSTLPEHHLIFVGDSRTLGMGNAEKDLADSCIYIGATGEGYNWFVEEGLRQMEEAMELYPDSPVVLNLGVNDPDMISHYLELYRSFAESYPNHNIYYMSVNPVTEESVHVSNMEIAEFNAKLREAFPEWYLDCNTYLRIKEFESVDGVHYSEDTYRTIHDFVVQQLAD